MPTRSVRPVAAFDPRLLLALKKAAETGLTIPTGDRNKAVTLRHRLYSLRKSMRVESHPDFPLVAKLIFRIYQDPNKGFCLIAEPGDDVLGALVDSAIPDIPDLEL